MEIVNTVDQLSKDGGPVPYGRTSLQRILHGIYDFHSSGKQLSGVQAAMSIDLNMGTAVEDEEYLEALIPAVKKSHDDFQPGDSSFMGGADPYCEIKLGGLSLTKERVETARPRRFRGSTAAQDSGGHSSWGGYSRAWKTPCAFSEYHSRCSRCRARVPSASVARADRLLATLLPGLPNCGSASLTLSKSASFVVGFLCGGWLAASSSQRAEILCKPPKKLKIYISVDWKEWQVVVTATNSSCRIRYSDSGTS